MTDINVEPPPDSQPKAASTTRAGDLWEPFRLSLLAAGEFYRGLAEASADSFRVFNDALETPKDPNVGLTCDFFEGLAQGNAQFYETLAKSSRRMADFLRPEGVERKVASEIDYPRLAKLVAMELKELDRTSKS